MSIQCCDNQIHCQMELSFAIVLLLVSFVPPSIAGYSLAEIKPWCAQVLYPDICVYFFTHSSKYGNIPIQQKSDFLKISLQLVLDRAINATEVANQLGSKCRNDLEKAAWVDCLDLYENTITILNQTNDPDIKATPYDEQTWLSTTLTNLDTCKQGFIDLGITDNVMPLIIDIMLQNLSINALALNSDSCNDTSYQDGFPTWEERLLQFQSFQPNVVVAKDGSGNYRKVQDAVDAASKRRGSERFIIYVKAGIYEEYIYIQLYNVNVMLIGEGIGKTIITGNRSASGGFYTFTSGTVIVEARGFIARDITFRNTAGPGGSQAVALRSDSDYSVYYKCSFEGYQDTLYVRNSRQFFRECNVYGTVDFIFGDAAVVFQKCTILARNPPNLTNTITAQKRSNFAECTGISFDHCYITVAPDLIPIPAFVKTYLGRPWKQYSRVVFMNTFLDSLIDPEGWLSWEGIPNYNLYYGEYNNNGPGSSTGQRVHWPGYHAIHSYDEASHFTVRKFIHGNSWLPSTGTPFDSDL